MSLTVHTDPQEPAGGFAFLEVPEGTLSADVVMVAVFDAYSERWLAASEAAGQRIDIGNPHWQAEKYDFGPYSVYSHQGAQWVRIGPEIVNKVEEYAPLRIEVAGTAFDVVWPDDVPPRAGAAVLGGLQPVSKAPGADAGARLVGKRPPEPEPEAEPAPETLGPGDDAEADTVVPTPVARQGETKGGNRGLLGLLVVLLLLVAAGAAAWFFWPETSPEQITDVAPTPEPTPVVTTPPPATDPCSFAALSALEGGFGSIEAALRSCGSNVAPDLAMGFVEEFAAQEDGAALLLLGTLYDGTELDEQIETQIGLNFEPDDARAAEYYARARDAGSEVAASRLGATCARLQNASSTLARGAYDDYCG